MKFKILIVSILIVTNIHSMNIKPMVDSLNAEFINLETQGIKEYKCDLLIKDVKPELEHLKILSNGKKLKFKYSNFEYSIESIPEEYAALDIEKQIKNDFSIFMGYWICRKDLQSDEMLAHVKYSGDTLKIYKHGTDELTSYIVNIGIMKYQFSQLDTNGIHFEFNDQYVKSGEKYILDKIGISMNGTLVSTAKLKSEKYAGRYWINNIKSTSYFTDSQLSIEYQLLNCKEISAK